MRATVEIDDQQWAAIKSIAAERGEKGYAPVLKDALAFYLSHRAEQDYETRLRAITSAAGSISNEEAERMQEVVRELRASWR